jgi:hypothetical protein
MVGIWVVPIPAAALATQVIPVFINLRLEMAVFFIA